MSNQIVFDKTEYVDISGIENGFEAQLITSILSERGIPHLIHSFHDTAYDGLFQVQKGWGKITAPLNYQMEILKIIRLVRSKNP